MDILTAHWIANAASLCILMHGIWSFLGGDPLWFLAGLFWLFFFVFTLVLLCSKCNFYAPIDSFVGNRELCGKQIQVCKRNNSGSTPTSDTPDSGKMFWLWNCSCILWFTAATFHWYKLFLEIVKRGYITSIFSIEIVRRCSTNYKLL